ncbi:MAG: hypothetical protein WC346_05140 [Methanogenium sp.]
MIADFQTVWGETWHQPWQPIYPNDLRLHVAYDFFGTIVGRVKLFNESYDITIVGDRGLGKSAFGLSAAKIINSRFRNDPNAEFSLNNVCFDVESWIELTNDLADRGGGVVILDEVGTEGSLSSRTSMSKGNRATSDIIQLCRTDRIITIYISTDRDRIDKRVRQLTSVMTTPIAKLDDEATNGYGLAIEADIRYRRTKPATEGAYKQRNENDSGYLMHEVSSIHYGPKGRIYSVVVPHAPIDLWVGYEAKRAAKLDELRRAGFAAYDGKAAIDEIAKLQAELNITKKQKSRQK